MRKFTALLAELTAPEPQAAADIDGVVAALKAVASTDDIGELKTVVAKAAADLVQIKKVFEASVGIATELVMPTAPMAPRLDAPDQAVRPNPYLDEGDGVNEHEPVEVMAPEVVEVSTPNGISYNAAPQPVLNPAQINIPGPDLRTPVPSPGYPAQMFTPGNGIAKSAPQLVVSSGRLTQDSERRVTATALTFGSDIELAGE